MKKLLLLVSILSMWEISHAQYYGNPLFREGFDQTVFPSGWTQTNLVQDDPCRWTISEKENNPFSLVDGESLHSASFVIEENDRPVVMLTSPEIDLTNKKDLLIGFYGYELSDCFRNGAIFKFRVSKDKGKSWTDLFDSERNDSYAGEKIKNWNLYKYSLPEEFEGKNICLQFYVDGSRLTYGSGFTGYIDGVFVSERYAVDPEIVDVNYSVNKLQPSSGAYSQQEPVTVTLKNNGRNSLTSVKLYYKVDDFEPIIETYILDSPLLTGETRMYSFKNKADFSALDTSITLKIGIQMEEDENKANNELVAYLYNLTVGIPYIPKFYYLEDGAPTYDNDQWTTLEKEGDSYWDNETEEDNLYWYVSHEWCGSDCDVYLISRPVKLEKGKTYDMKFDAYTEGKEWTEQQLNKMSVYVSKNKNLEGELTEIWSNMLIDGTNAYNSFARYTAPESGIYYFSFGCKSPKTANTLWLKDISIREVMGTDAGIVAFLSPENKRYLYGDNEGVEVMIHNYGLTAIPSNSMKVGMQLNNEKAIVENISEVIKPNSQIKHFFKTKVNLSNINVVKKLTAWTSLVGDENEANDSLRVTLTSIVSGIPYVADFGTDRIPSQEPLYWESVDNNGDGFAFNSASDGDLKTYVFSYGGGRVGWQQITVPTSDEKLYSRPIWLETGRQYKFSYLSRIDKEDSRMPLSVNIYRIKEDNKIFVKELWKGEVNTYDYQPRLFTIEVNESGVYEIEFRVVNPEPVSFKIKLACFKMTQIYDTDLSLEKILIPTSHITCYNHFPVGAVVKNEGRNTITSFALKGECPSMGKVKQDVTGISLLPGESYITWFDKDLAFNGADQEQLIMSASVIGDNYEENDRKSMEITYGESGKIPYATPPYTLPEGWMTINNNRDSFIFDFQQTLDFVGYRYIADKHVNADDVLATKCLELKKEQTYSLNFNYGTWDNDSASVDIYALNTATGQKITIASFRDISGRVKGNQFIGYFTIKESGNYCICFQVLGTTKSFLIAGGLEVKEVQAKPDIELLEVVSPAKDAVFTHSENIEVTFKNTGKLPLSGIPFTCKVGDRLYHSVYYNMVSPTDEVFKVEFSGVDLYIPGNYTLQVQANVGEDVTPDNNLLDYTVNSLPVPDIKIMSLDTPQSGALTKNERLTVTLMNAGKGTLKNIPLKCLITAEPDYRKVANGILEGPLADGETIQYTFEEIMDLYQENNYHFTISAELPEDIVPDDNQKEWVIVSTHKNLDTGVTKVLSPVDNILTEKEKIKIEIKNYSEVDLFNIPIVAQVYREGEEQILQTVTATLEEIKAGMSAEYTFGDAVNMQVAGKYYIHSYTDLQNDMNSANDTCRVIVKCLKTDVGVTAILSPETGEDLGLQEITIEVKNFGEAPVKQIPVRYKVGSMPQLGTIDGILEPGEKMVYSFPIGYEFMAYKKYAINAYTALENDANNDNDGCIKEIENKPNNIVENSFKEKLVYPNPSKNGELNISLENVTNLQSVIIFNLQGSVVARYDEINSSFYQINTGLSAGSYLLRLVTSEGTYYNKWIISK